MFDVEAILRSASLIELAERAGAKFRHVGNEWRSHCPLHGGDDPTAFAVYEKDGKELWQCFSGTCGGGDLISFVQVWQNKDFKGACAFLGGDVLSDPAAMEKSARERHELAAQRAESARLEEEARRKELQREQRHLYYHEHMLDWMRQAWIQRGIDESWQGFWYLGGCESFDIGGYCTPTLTIPIFDPARVVLNIKHRLLKPQNPKDKYRPEKSGLGPCPPFLAIPEMGYDGHTVWVIEGEIKAMVCATRTPTTDWQYIGVPGRSQYKSLIEKLFGKNVIVVPDPGAERDAADFCKRVNGRYLPVNEKIDDMMLANGLGANWLLAMSKQARRV